MNLAVIQAQFNEVTLQRNIYQERCISLAARIAELEDTLKRKEEAEKDVAVIKKPAKETD